MMPPKQALLKLARTRWAGAVLRFWLRYAPATLPVRPLYRSPSLLAILHPAPSYPVHLLLLPLPPLNGVQSLRHTDSALIAEVFNSSRRLAADLEIDEGWQLVVNAGAYQEVRVLHFHLIAGSAPLA